MVNWNVAHVTIQSYKTTSSIETSVIEGSQHKSNILSTIFWIPATDVLYELTVQTNTHIHKRTDRDCQRLSYVILHHCRSTHKTTGHHMLNIKLTL